MKKSTIMRVERKWFLNRRRELFEVQKEEDIAGKGFFEHVALDPGEKLICEITGEEIRTHYVDVYVSPWGKEYALCRAKSEELQKDGCKVEMHESLMVENNPASQRVS